MHLLMAAILDFHSHVWVKKLKTAFFVFAVNLKGEKLQVYNLYEKFSNLHIDILNLVAVFKCAEWDCNRVLNGL